MAGEEGKTSGQHSADEPPVVDERQHDTGGGATVQASDAEGSTHEHDHSLSEGVSADVAPVVEEFMEQAAHQNEAANEAVTEEGKAEGEEDAPYISFEDVSKSFGDFKVLQNVNFWVRPGETLCILGRSGVGKSVSLQMLLGFLKPDAGKVLVAGEDITGFAEAQLQAIRRKVTMVFQSGALFDSITVGENVAFPLRERGELHEDQIFQVVKGLLELVGVAGMDPPAAERSFHRHEAIRRDCPRARQPAGGGAL